MKVILNQKKELTNYVNKYDEHPFLSIKVLYINKVSNKDMDYYNEWLKDNNFQSSEELLEYWSNNYCQYCGNGIDNHTGDCGCDHVIRYTGE